MNANLCTDGKKTCLGDNKCKFSIAATSSKKMLECKILCACLNDKSFLYCVFGKKESKEIKIDFSDASHKCLLQTVDELWKGRAKV